MKSARDRLRHASLSRGHLRTNLRLLPHLWLRANLRLLPHLRLRANLRLYRWSRSDVVIEIESAALRLWPARRRRGTRNRLRGSCTAAAIALCPCDIRNHDEQ